jgi:hypothetical protein
MVNINFKAMPSLIFKVSDKIPKELDLIQEEEGLGNRTSTLTFLIKYYFLTKKNSLEQSIQIMDKLLDRIDASKLASAKDQLKDV